MYDNEYEYGSMNLVKITMGAVFEGAVGNDYIIKNPAKSVKCKQRDVKDRRVLTICEQEDFVKYAQHSMYYQAYVLALETGLRVGEIGGLKWSDVDFKNRTIHVQRTLLFNKEKGGFYFGKPKTKTSNRIVPLTDLAIEMLNQQKINQFKLRAKSNKWTKEEKYSDLVFTTINGLATNSATFRNNIIRIVTNINKDRRAVASINKEEFVEFEPMHMHSLRHTFATRCIENDMKPKTLQTILGHSSVTITMDLYVHSTEEEKHKEIKKLKVVGV
jgi:integrase